MKSLSLLLCFVAVLSIMPRSVRADTTIEQALAQAYQSNPELQAARAGLRAIDEGVSEAYSGYRPSIDAIANVGKLHETATPAIPFGSSGSDLTPRSYGVEMRQPLFRGFRTEAAVKAADNKVLAARAQLATIEQKLLLDTAVVFLDIVREEAVLELDRSNEDVLQQRLDETKDLFSAGMVTQTDVSQAESRLARAHANSIQAEGTLAIDRMAYLRLVNDMPGSIQKPNISLNEPRVLEDIVHLAETQNPSVISAGYTVDQARDQVDINKGSLLPEVDLVGHVHHQWEQNILVPGREDESQILIQMKMPLYRSGADYSRTRAAQQTLTQHRMELENARRKAHEEAVNAWQTYVTAQAALHADESVTKAAQMALDGVMAETKAGTRTTLDVLNAEQELLDAKVDFVRTEHDESIAILRIKAAAGQLTAEALKLPVELYNPKNHYDDVRNKWFGFEEASEEK